METGKKTYGKLLNARQEGTSALIGFENGALEITAYTDFIIRVFSDFSGVHPVSFAIEGNKKLTPMSVLKRRKDASSFPQRS